MDSEYRIYKLDEKLEKQLEVTEPRQGQVKLEIREALKQSVKKH